ncbi:MAG TPA: PAS domain-containing protein, partial [bacterium]
EEHGYRAGKEIREMVTFATQNVITDPPFTKLDILLCRNLLIYLTPEVQNRLIALFHYALNAGGYLFLGNSESLGAGAALFSPLSAKFRLYRRRESALRTGFEGVVAPYRRPLPGASPEAQADRPSANLQALAEQALLRRYAPPAVLVSDKGDILYVSGRTGAYLEPAAGKANWNVFAMAREGLRLELSSAFQQAARSRGQVIVRGARVAGGGRTQLVEVTVQVLEEPEALRGLSLIVFNDVPAPSAKSAAKRGKGAGSGGAGIAALEREFQHCRDELQSAREQMQTTLEEQKSSNEELQSANEELQSTNEELTTSREELQSLNEELQTVNAEQQARLDEFQRVSNDMKNLLESTEIVTVFLDRELRVRRFTSGASRIFKLIQSDVGRPLTDITSVLRYPEMPEDGREVLRSLVFSEKSVATTDGRWFSVRIMPYRTDENVIDGLVITFVDITVAKTLEARLRAAAGPGTAEGDGG